MKKQENMTNEHEFSRKRKNNNHGFQIPRRFSSDLEEEDDDLLTLSLSFRPSRTRELSPPPPPTPPTLSPLSLPPQETLISQPIPLLQSFLSHHSTPPNFYFQQPTFPPPPPPLPPSTIPTTSANPVPSVAGPSRPVRQRRNPSQTPREGKSDTIPVPYPWATNKRATVHSLTDLESKDIFTITGEVQCKRCEKQYEMGYDLREKFVEVGRFVAENKSAMRDRAPGVWMNPVPPTCKFCGQENSVKPIIADKKKSINWLFLLLGQLLGCCTLEQLKYFCKHTKNHRTGAKDRVLYLTYLGLCKQLDPNGPFDR